jgi:crotonobetainyl-CoA:carnitine CoA-transferase CaiB-like acyl-CoA transferase
MFTALRQRLAQKTRDEWCALFREANVCVTPVYGMDEAVADPHARAREMIVDLSDPRFGTIRQIGVAPKFSDTPGSVRTPAPRPGEHTEEVLQEIGYSPEEIAKLISRDG